MQEQILLTVTNDSLGIFSSDPEQLAQVHLSRFLVNAMNICQTTGQKAMAIKFCETKEMQ